MIGCAAGSPAALTRLVAAASHWGRPGLVFGHNVDLLRSVGLRTLLDFRDDAAASDARGRGRLMAVYGEIWERAAAEVGAEVTAFGQQFLEIRSGDLRTIVRHRRVMLDDEVTLLIALNKALVHQLLTLAKVRVPAYRGFPTDDTGVATDFLRTVDDFCVVKPATGTAGGNGVTCGVRTADDLARAVVRAARWSQSLLIEEQGHGREYRFLVLDGEVIDVVRRTPPRVVGDGRSGLAELIAAENERRRGSNGRLGLAHIHLDLDCVLTLRRAGLTLRSVPDRGRVVPVKTMANENGPLDNETVFDVSAELISEVSRAALAVGLRLASVEVMTTDHWQSLTSVGGVIFEVNGTPGLHYHYQVRDPQRATPVATVILQRLLAEAARQIIAAPDVGAAGDAHPVAGRAV